MIITKWACGVTISANAGFVLQDLLQAGVLSITLRRVLRHAFIFDVCSTLLCNVMVSFGEILHCASDFYARRVRFLRLG
jgi:hypothetical protein